MRKPSTLFVAWCVLITCIVIGVFFWNYGGGYRAVSPLVFILGIVGFYLCMKGALNNPFKEGNFNPRSGLNKLLASRKFQAQKRLLWKNHIPELIAGLYLRHIRQYPDWKDTAPEFMPESITAVVQLAEGSEKIILNLNEYEFAFKEWSYKTPDGQSHTHGLLEIFIGDKKKVFGLLLAKAKTPDGGLRWEADNIEAFEPGDWLDDFKKLSREILEIIHKKTLESHEG